jgi:hypothetical protein
MKFLGIHKYTERVSVFSPVFTVVCSHLSFQLGHFVVFLFQQEDCKTLVPHSKNNSNSFSKTLSIYIIHVHISIYSIFNC